MDGKHRLQWPCVGTAKKFGFTGTDIDLIHSHVETFHGSSEETTTHITLVDTGTEAQPVYFKHMKQNFGGLVMENEGNIVVECLFLPVAERNGL